MKRKLKYIVLSILLFAFLAVGITNLREHNHQVKLKEIQLQDTGVKLKNLNEEYNKLLNESKVDDTKLKQLEEEKKELEKQLQAKLERQEAERQKVAYAAKLTTPVQAASYSGTCAEWIVAAGITDVHNANELIRRESGCNPHAVNKSSGACGVAQELPCGKSGCSMGDGACQVRWMNGYVTNRYGSWANAVAFHNSNNWY